MPTMLKPEFYLKRIAKTRDPISFTLEVVKYNSFLTDRAKWLGGPGFADLALAGQCAPSP